jgi:hypothetical protein
VRSEVQIFPDPPHHGAIAQMGERLICIQEVGGSIPPGSTIVEVSVANKIFIQCSVVGLSEMRRTGTLDLIFKNL